MFRSLPSYWRSNFGGLKKLRRTSKDPNVINSKVYWCFEHRYIRRTVLSLCNNNPHTKLFSKLLNPEQESGYKLSHQLSLPGPFTGFIPVNSGLEPELGRLKSTNDAEDFVKSHFTTDLWLFRDLIGAPTQPWLLYNRKRKAPKQLQTLTNKTIFLDSSDFSEGGPEDTQSPENLPFSDKNVFVNGVRVLRFNLRCHNGVIHLVEKPLF